MKILYIFKITKKKIHSLNKDTFLYIFQTEISIEKILSNEKLIKNIMKNNFKFSDREIDIFFLRKYRQKSEKEYNKIKKTILECKTLEEWHSLNINIDFLIRDHIDDLLYFLNKIDHNYKNIKNYQKIISNLNEKFK